MSFDFSTLYRKNLPPAAARWKGLPEFNFTGGNNDAEHVPVEELTAAVARALARDGQSLATYNMECGSLGYLPLREQIAAQLSERAGLDCDAEQVLVVSGSLQALDLANGVFLEPGDTVIVEAQTYFGTLLKIKRCGADWVGVGVDDDGMITDELAAALETLKGRGVRPKFIYTIPTVQNPTGTVMSRERRMELLRLAGEYGVPIFEDDCYADLLWDGERPPAIRALDDSGRVFYCGSFSKSVAPALRVGYIVADWPLLSQMISLKLDGGTGGLDQMALAEFASARFNDHVDSLQQVLKAKRDAMAAALEENFGSAAKIWMPRGGIFMWVTLPDGVDTTRLAEAALAEGVAINAGADWSADPESGRHSFRLCFGSPSIETIRAGIARLAAVCRRETGIPQPMPAPTPPMAG